MWPVLTYCTFNSQWRPVFLPHKQAFNPHKSHLAYLLSIVCPSGGRRCSASLTYLQQAQVPRRLSGFLIPEDNWFASREQHSNRQHGGRNKSQKVIQQTTSVHLFNKLMAVGTNDCQSPLAAILFTLKWRPEGRVWKSECSGWSTFRRNAWAWLWKNLGRAGKRGASFVFSLHMAWLMAGIPCMPCPRPAACHVQWWRLVHIPRAGWRKCFWCIEGCWGYLSCRSIIHLWRLIPHAMIIHWLLWIVQRESESAVICHKVVLVVKLCWAILGEGFTDSNYQQFLMVKFV